MISSFVELTSVLALFSATPAMAVLPPDAKAMLKTFPGEQITLDLVLGRALKASDNFKIIKASLATIPIPYLQAQTPLDTEFGFKGSRIVDTNEPQTQFNPSKRYVSQYSFEGTRYFQSGTLLRAELLHDKTTYAFNTFPGDSFNETRAAFSVSQNFWNDMFGYATRRNLKAGEFQTRSNRLEFQEAVEDFTYDIVGIYYGAWLAQARVKAAKANEDLRQRLLQVTTIKARRGTAERPDVLQVNSALMNARVQKYEAAQALGDRWRNLVTSLKLPMDWVNIDPAELPIELDTPVGEALESCGPENALKSPPKSTPKTESLELQAHAAKLSAESAKNRLAPAVRLNGGFITNGIDSFSRVTSFKEALYVDHPAWKLELAFSMPLGNYAEMARAHAAVAELDRLEARVSQASDMLRLDWLNRCANLHRLQRSYNLLTEAYEAQLKRVNLEEARFRIGRASTLAVIQAGDDAIAAELKLRDAEVERRMAAWSVRRLATGYKVYLQKLEAESGQ